MLRLKEKFSYGSGRKLEGPKKSSLFFGWPKIKGAEIFPKPLYNIKKNEKMLFIEGGRKLKGPK